MQQTSDVVRFREEHSLTITSGNKHARYWHSNWLTFISTSQRASSCYSRILMLGDWKRGVHLSHFD